MNFHDVMRKHARVAITGGPKAGKSTLAARVFDRPVFHTDDHNDIPWEEVPGKLIAKTQRQNKFALEGVHALGAIKKGLPVDAIIHLDANRADEHLKVIGGEPLRPGQRSMHKAQATILEQVKTQFPHIPVYTL